MHPFLILSWWAFITFVSSSQFQDEPWSFDDISFTPESWSSDDLSPFPESDFSENEPMSSNFLWDDGDLAMLYDDGDLAMPYDDGDWAMGTTAPMDSDLAGGEELSGSDESNPVSALAEFYPEDEGISIDGFAPSDINQDWMADCTDWFQYNGKRRAKREASCKDPTVSNTEKKPDGTGPPPPTPGGPSFFPGYGKYIMDKKTNILRIPGYTPRFHGENDVCLIYTEGYLPYGVCGTTLFNSVESFWGIETYTITQAVLGMLYLVLKH